MAIPPCITVASWIVLALSVVGNATVAGTGFGIHASETSSTGGTNVVGKIHGGVVVGGDGRAVTVLRNWSHAAVVGQVTPLVSRTIGLRIAWLKGIEGLAEGKTGNVDGTAKTESSGESHVGCTVSALALFVDDADSTVFEVIDNKAAVISRVAIHLKTLHSGTTRIDVITSSPGGITSGILADLITSVQS